MPSPLGQGAAATEPTGEVAAPETIAVDGVQTEAVEPGETGTEPEVEPKAEAGERGRQKRRPGHPGGCSPARWSAGWRGSRTST